ncbi:MAG: hypothetical protein AUJ48_02510 [Deltaproteobacteria bacterium CG1_02_45_11]|nr:MAG: hypothetical protein AUJ48_02510 [Deltaproteobacteria bacterium CG1_02_45_11]
MGHEGRYAVKTNFSQLSIVAIGIFICFSNFPSFAFANGPAPLNEESVVRQIKENMAKSLEDYVKEGGDLEDGAGMALFIKKSHEEAFKNCGYDFSKTISKMAQEGFNKEDKLFQELILPLIFQVSYMGEGGPESMFEVFPENDARNLIKIGLIQNAKNRDRDLPDYNVYGRAEIDLLLRNKWESMTSALRNGNLKEAIQYFVSQKRPAYKEIFGTSSGKVKCIIKTTNNMKIVDFNFSEVKYAADVDMVADGVQRTISSYIIFERDEDGLWRISFF